MHSIESMHVFLAVAELGSFTQAANRLTMPRAAVSLAVQQLENELGARLLHRTTRQVALTQDGQAFVERCKAVLEDFGELRAMFRDSDGAESLSGRIRVDMPTPVARDLVIPSLGDFLDVHPGLEIELSSTDRRVDLIAEGFDCVVRGGDISAPNLLVVPLGRYAMSNLASAAYIARYGQPQDLGALRHHRLIRYAPTLGIRDRGFEYVDPDDSNETRYIEMTGALTVNNIDAYHAACLAGFGIVQVPRGAMSRELAASRVVELLTAYTPPPMPLSIVYANRRHQPQRVRAFIQWFRALVAQRSDQGLL